MTDWFRSWHGAPTDTKWLVIARKASVKPGMVSAVVWALFDYASQALPRGDVSGFDPETYAEFSGFEFDAINSVIKVLGEKRIIVGGKLTAWEKRQPKREDSSTERTRGWRERNRTPDAIPVTQCDARTEQSREDTEQKRSEQKEGSSGAQAAPVEKQSRKKPAKRIPDDWKPTSGTSAYAKGLGLLDTDIRKEIERFRNNARQHDRTVSDWDMAFRNWCMKAVEFLGRSPPPAPGETVVPTHGDVLPDGQTYLKAETHEYDAWADYYRRQGQKHPPRYFHGGWKFPDRWPPGALRNVENQIAAE